ncbi:hypothetical protein N799_05240 [Lysobacter arseniciresistens ZS79]|uniref:Uncharacterized protein n=2 Tax=Novilysobacter TaxID=3382699 RepID=A0A0A0F4N6_9GAMM|nr:hypothetical protein N799_05240 [Lysobacter arseniciresistens ZS79]
MLRQTPVVAQFLLTKERVKKKASAAFQGMNALELLLARPDPLPKTWSPVVDVLVKLGLKVKTKTKINEKNRSFLGEQAANTQAKQLDRKTPKAAAPSKQRRI